MSFPESKAHNKMIQQNQPKQQRFNANRLSIRDEPTTSLARTTNEQWNNAETELLSSPSPTCQWAVDIIKSFMNKDEIGSLLNKR